MNTKNKKIIFIKIYIVYNNKNDLILLKEKRKKY